MPKVNGSVSWKAFLMVVALASTIIGACFVYASTIANRCQKNEIKTAQVEAGHENLRGDLQDFREEQRQWNSKQEQKLDRILERLPR